jgi:hypothetical protein
VLILSKHACDKKKVLIFLQNYPPQQASQVRQPSQMTGQPMTGQPMTAQPMTGQKTR